MMHLRKLSLLVTLAAALLQECKGQAPANDDFANRILLTGNAVTFSGDLTGSTIEPNEPRHAKYWPVFPGTNSVWWTWTATESGPVTLTVLSCTEDSYVSGLGDLSCALEVYPGTNIFDNPLSNALCSVFINPVMNKPSVSFQASAGTEYQLQFLGAKPSMAATFQLVATNGPVILEPPSEQTVFPNGSALFTVLAAGIPPLSYQWRFNGIDLPGQNGPMLALFYVTTNQAGAYSVIVSNATGGTLSSSANLTVNPHPISPVLHPLGKVGFNAFALTLTGESGRYYEIECSTNFSVWNTVTNFPATTPLIAYPASAVKFRNVVYCTNTTISLVVSNTDPAAIFYRASLYQPVDEACETHLKQIRFVKQLWQKDTTQSRDAVPYYLDLEVYWADINSAGCPLVGNHGPFGASYTMQYITVNPDCKVSNQHVLREPR